jgi:hypothetical protein
MSTILVRYMVVLLGTFAFLMLILQLPTLS